MKNQLNSSMAAKASPVAPAAVTGGDEEVEEWDTIVIGSGMGGLSVASLLSQCEDENRRRVLVLEQHPWHAGGCCQAFERDGYRFGVGVHFVGDMDEGNKLKKMVDALTQQDDKIEWTQMKDLHSTMIGKEKLKAYAIDSNTSLKEHFPSEEDSIATYVEMSRKASRCCLRALVFKSLPRWVTSFLVNTGLDRILNRGYRKYAKMTVDEVFRSLPIEDTDLKILLGGACGAYGMTPEEAPFIMHSLLVGMGDEVKLFYPSGGPGMIPQKIIRAIEAKGGEVRVNSNVVRILIEGKRAVGVELSDGKTIRAKHRVISDAGFVKTFRQLVPKEHQPNHLRMHTEMSSDKNSLRNGMTGVVLYVGLKGEYDDDYHLPGNLFVISTDSGEKSLPETLDGLTAMEAGDLNLYITCPGGKDGSWKKNYPGKTTLEILLMNVPWMAFEGLLGDDGMIKAEMKDQYDQFKRNFGQLIWKRTRQALVEAGASAEKLPESLDDADFHEVGTPLTFHHFLGSDRGAWYGLEHSRDRFHPRNYYLLLRPECGDVAGLYLTGEDVATDGVSGAMLGGYLCAAKILGEKTPTGVIEKVDAANNANKA